MNTVALVWKVASWFLSSHRINLPENVLIFDAVPLQPVLGEIVRVFQSVYALPPWNEVWTTRDIEEKLRREVSDKGITVLIIEKDSLRGIGFSWGAVITPDKVIPRVIASFPNQSQEVGQGLAEELVPLLPKRFFYWDEIALLPMARGGLEPIRQLTLPLLDFADQSGVQDILFRSTPEANIVRFTRLMGFQPIYRRQVGEMKEIYLLLSNLRPILRIAGGLSARQVRKILRLLSKRSKARM